MRCAALSPAGSASSQCLVDGKTHDAQRTACERSTAWTPEIDDYVGEPITIVAGHLLHAVCDRREFGNVEGTRHNPGMLDVRGDASSSCELREISDVARDDRAALLHRITELRPVVEPSVRNGRGLRGEIDLPGHSRIRSPSSKSSWASSETDRRARAAACSRLVRTDRRSRIVVDTVLSARVVKPTRRDGLARSPREFLAS